MAWSSEQTLSVLRVLSSASDLAVFGQHLESIEGIAQWIAQQLSSGNTAALQRLMQEAQLVQLLAHAFKQGMQLMQRLPEPTMCNESDARAQQAVFALCDSLRQCLIKWRALFPAADEEGTKLKIAMQITRSGLLPVLAATSPAEARLLETCRQQLQQEKQQEEQHTAHASRSHSRFMTLTLLQNKCVLSSCLLRLCAAIIQAWLPPVLASKALLPTLQPAVRLAAAVLHAMPFCFELTGSSNSSSTCPQLITNISLAMMSVCDVADTAKQLLGEGTIPLGSSEVQQLLALPATQQLLAYHVALLAQNLHQKQHGRSSVPAAASASMFSTSSGSSSRARSSQQVEVPAHHTALLEAMGLCCMEKDIRINYAPNDVELACMIAATAASRLVLTSTGSTSAIMSGSSTSSTSSSSTSSTSSTSKQHPAAALPHTQMLLVLLELAALQPTPNVVCCTLAALQKIVLCFDSQAPAEQRAAAAGTLVQQVVQLLTPAVWAVASGHAEKDGFVPRMTVREELEVQPGDGAAAATAAASKTLAGKELLQRQALLGFVRTLAGLICTTDSYDDLAACFSQQPSLCSITMEAALREASARGVSKRTQACGIMFARGLARSAHISLLDPAASSSKELQQQLFSLLISALKCVAGICDSLAPAGWTFRDLLSLVKVEGIIAATCAIRSSSSRNSSAAGQLLPQPEVAGLWLVLSARNLWVAARVLEKQLQQLAAPGAAAAAGGPAAHHAEHPTPQQQQQEGIGEIRSQLPQYEAQVQWLGAVLPKVLQAAPGGGTPGALQQLSKLQDELLHTLEQTVQLWGERSSSSSSSAGAGMTDTPSAAALQEVLQVCGPALVAKMQQYAAGVSAQLPLPLCCNSPACTNVAAMSERHLVGGKSCICAGCQVARYCGKECQTQHWKQHKPVCRRIKAAAAAGEAAVGDA